MIQVSQNYLLCYYQSSISVFFPGVMAPRLVRSRGWFKSLRNFVTLSLAEIPSPWRYHRPFLTRVHTSRLARGRGPTSAISSSISFSATATIVVFWCVGDESIEGYLCICCRLSWMRPVLHTALDGLQNGC
jgi:hypothetical protein